MAEYLAQGNRVRGLFQQQMRVIVFGCEPLSVKFGQVFFYRVVQMRLALVHEHHQARCRNRLGLRGNPE